MEVPLETIVFLAVAAGIGLGIIICKLGNLWQKSGSIPLFLLIGYIRKGEAGK